MMHFIEIYLLLINILFGKTHISLEKIILFKRKTISLLAFQLPSILHTTSENKVENVEIN